MLKIATTIICLLFFLAPGCAKSEVVIHPEVNEFIQLLISADEPTLIDYERFSGEGDPSEVELFFELKECHSRGWADASKPCVDFVRNRWSSAGQHRALFIAWLREQFSTVGNSYHLVSIESSMEGFSHDLVEVDIGGNRFLLFHNTDPTKPTGLVVGISRVNGKTIDDYLENKIK